jgi:lipopolysaccharide export system protein LptA
MAMSQNLSDRDFFVASSRAVYDSKSFVSTMSDDIRIKKETMNLTAKTAPVTKRPRREDRDLRNAFRF